MYKAIVVGTDGSARAAVAVAHALGLAKAHGATLHVVHAVRPLAMVGAGTNFAAIAVAEANLLHDQGDHIGVQVLAEAEREGVPAEMHNVDGDPADTLIRLAETVHADLVVVGNQGMSGVKRFVLGSVPNKVSHHCPCSVLIVNTDAATVSE
jgi:nucleotide-binding universal stress UspA family protein